MVFVISEAKMFSICSRGNQKWNEPGYYHYEVGYTQDEAEGYFGFFEDLRYEDINIKEYEKLAT